MKNKKYILVSLLCFTNFLYSFGQQWTNSQIVGDDFISIAPKKVNIDIEGSPFIPSDYVPAKISLYDNKIFALKYDALTDEMLIKNENDNSKIYVLKNNVSKNIKVTIISENKTYQISEYISKENEKKTGFFVILSELKNNIQLLKKEVVKFYEGKASTSGYDKAYPAEYKRLNDSYYLIINNQPAMEISSNKKDVTRLFPNHEKKIIDFIKSERIKLKDEEDFKRLLIFLQGL